MEKNKKSRNSRFGISVAEKEGFVQHSLGLYL
jgi:hypothetical protein